MGARPIAAMNALRFGDPNHEKTRHLVSGVVAGIGVQPNVELAQAAGLAVDNGIRVDTSLRTSKPDIYAAGDVASFHNPALDKWLRVEHEDNANTMNMRPAFRRFQYESRATPPG